MSSIGLGDTMNKNISTDMYFRADRFCSDLKLGVGVIIADLAECWIYRLHQSLNDIRATDLDFGFIYATSPTN